MRRLPFFIGGAAALLLLAAVILVATIDAERFRPELEARASAALGLPVRIEGPLRVAPGLTPTLRAEMVALQNPPGFSRPRLASVERLEVKARLFPILGGRLVVDRLFLSGLDVLLETDRAGRSNWQAGGGGGSGGAAPVVSDLRIQRARIAQADERTGTVRRLDLEALTLSRPDGEPATLLTARGMLADKPLDLALRIELPPEALLAADKAPFTLRGRLLDGSVELAGERDGAMGRVGGTLEIGPSSLLDLPGPLALSGDVTWDAKLLRFENLRAKLAGDAGLLAANGTFARAEEAFDVALSFGVTRPGALGKGLDGLPEVNGSGRLSGTMVRPVVSDLKLRIADAAFSGRGSADLAPGARTATLELSGPKLDLTPLFPRGKGGSRLFDDMPLPLPRLDGLSVAARLRVGQLQFRGLALQDVDAPLTLGPQGLALVPAGFTFAQGRHALELRMDQAQRAELKLSGKAIAMAEALRQLGTPALVEARGDLEVAVAGQGSSLAQLARGLSGQASLVTGAGTLHQRHVDLLATDLTRVMFPGGGFAPSAPLQCVVARLQIQGGVARPRMLLVETRNITITGGGQIDLGGETLDLVFDPKPRDASLVSLSAPFRLSGPLADPRVGPDAEGLARRAATTAIGLANPLGWVLALGSTGSGSLCAAASADRAPPPGRNQPADPAAGVVDQLKRFNPFQ